MDNGAIRTIEELLQAIEVMEDGAKPAKRGKDGTPRFALEKVLDTEHAQAVLDYRQRIKHPLTEYNAGRLAAEFGKCHNPNTAADYMMDRGWRSFEAGWMENGNGPDNRGRMGTASNGGSRHESLLRSFGVSPKTDHD